MLRYSTKRYEGDHFNFDAVDVPNGILADGLLGKPTLPFSFGVHAKEELTLHNVLIDENIDLCPWFRSYSMDTIADLCPLPASPPTNKLAIWHSVRLSSVMADAYGVGWVNYVFIESYWPWKSNFMLSLFFKRNYKKAFKAKIAHKIVFALGINQNRPRFRLFSPMTWWNSLPWANDFETISAQLRYIENNCPNIAGVAFFVASSSESFLRLVDKEANDLFPGNPPK